MIPRTLGEAIYFESLGYVLPLKWRRRLGKWHTWNQCQGRKLERARQQCYADLPRRVAAIEALLAGEKRDQPTPEEERCTPHKP